jgi:nucleotidyltransferase/DNA polymerase involved in DNA repair
LLAQDDDWLGLASIIPGLRVSAGIAQSKFLAKMASSASKPNGQTTVLPNSVSSMLARNPPSKIPLLGTLLLLHGVSLSSCRRAPSPVSDPRGEGVKLGKEKRALLLQGPWKDRVWVIADLASASLWAELRHDFGDDKAEWLRLIGQGVDDEPVKDKGPSLPPWPCPLLPLLVQTALTDRLI